MRLSRQAEKVLAELRNWTLTGASTRLISGILDVPEPSVRRAIGELRRKGFGVTRQRSWRVRGRTTTSSI